LFTLDLFGVHRRLSVGGIVGTVLGDLFLVEIADREQHGLRVYEIAALLAVVFHYAGLDDRVHRAGFLAETAADAFRDIDIVTRRPARTVIALLRFDGDRKRGAHRLAQFAGDAAFLAVGISAQRVKTAEARAH